MNTNTAIIVFAASLLFAGQTAFAQDASVQYTSAQSTASQAKATKRVVKRVGVPVQSQKKTVHKTGKTRVIYSANLARADINAYRGGAKKTSTPNLYRD